MKIIATVDSDTDVVELNINDQVETTVTKQEFISLVSGETK